MTQTNAAGESPAETELPVAWLRWTLIAAAAIETASALNDVPILFGDLSQVPGPGLGGAMVTAKLALAPVAAVVALTFAVKGRLRPALLALAAIVLLTWISYLPSLAVHGFDGGDGTGGLFTTFHIVLAPFLAGAIAALAIGNQRLALATGLAIVPTLVDLLGVALFAISVALYGF